MLDGIQSVVLAVVAQAVVGFGRRPDRPPLVGTTAAAVVALYMAGVNELVLLAGGALVPLVSTGRVRREQMMAMLPIWPVGTGTLPLKAEQGYSHGQLFWTFLPIGTALYGSG